MLDFMAYFALVFHRNQETLYRDAQGKYLHCAAIRAFLERSRQPLRQPNNSEPQREAICSISEQPRCFFRPLPIASTQSAYLPIWSIFFTV
jgi:hypothetical protein